MAVRILGGAAKSAPEPLTGWILEHCCRCDSPLVTERFEFRDPKGGAYPNGLHGTFCRPCARLALSNELARGKGEPTRRNVLEAIAAADAVLLGVPWERQ